MRGVWRAKMLLKAVRERLAVRRALRRVRQFPRTRRKAAHGLSTELIVSLTSYPARFDVLGWTLRSLLDQAVAADRTILWIAHGDMDRLPADVTALTAHGLEVRACDDLRSYKKLVPALEAFPNATIVTADDDIYYPTDWLGRLLATNSSDPAAAVATRAHLARTGDDGKLEPYRHWDFATSATRATGKREYLFPTGIGGVLYPAGVFDARVTDRDAFQRLAPNADDVWFFWMTRLNGRRAVRVPGATPLVEWPDSQDVALFHDNWLGDGNDSQIRAMEDAFGPLP